LIPGAFGAAGWFGFRAVLRGKSSGASVRPVPPARSRLALRFVGLFVMLLGGLGFWAMAIRPAMRTKAAKAWVQTPCVVDSGRIITHTGDRGSVTYELLIHYHYQYSGGDYLGDRYDFAEGSSSNRGWREQALAAYPPHQPARCFVNPAAPWESVLIPQQGKDWWFGLIPGFFALVGIGLFFGAGRIARANPATAAAARAQAAAKSSGVYGPGVASGRNPRGIVVGPDDRIVTTPHIPGSAQGLEEVK
jgi:hypothetical protein